MKKIGIVLAILVLIITGCIAYLRDKNPMSKEEMQQQFKCHRKTMDIQATDKYCADYELYKRDHAAGII